MWIIVLATCYPTRDDVYFNAYGPFDTSKEAEDYIMDHTIKDRPGLKDYQIIIMDKPRSR